LGINKWIDNDTTYDIIRNTRFSRIDLFAENILYLIHHLDLDWYISSSNKAQKNEKIETD